MLEEVWHGSHNLALAGFAGPHTVWSCTGSVSPQICLAEKGLWNSFFLCVAKVFARPLRVGLKPMLCMTNLLRTSKVPLESSGMCH